MIFPGGKSRICSSFCWENTDVYTALCSTKSVSEEQGNFLLSKHAMKSSHLHRLHNYALKNFSVLLTEVKKLTIS